MALPRRAFVITGVFFLFVGAVLLINSFAGVTGYSIFDGSDYEGGFLVAVWFFVAAAVVLGMSRAGNGGLVKIVRTE